MSSVSKLLDEIDRLDVFNGRSAAIKLEDCEGSLRQVEAELIALRRMLVQHGNPKGVINDQGMTIENAIRSTIKQIQQLRKYRDELREQADAEQEEIAQEEAQRTAEKNGSEISQAEKEGINA